MEGVEIEKKEAYRSWVEQVSNGLIDVQQRTVVMEAVSRHLC